MQTQDISATKDQKHNKKLRIIIDDTISKDSIQLKLFSWTSVHLLKLELQKKTKIPKRCMRILHKNTQLKLNHKSIADYGIRNNSVLKLHPNHILQQSIGIIESYQIFDPVEPQPIAILLKEVQSGFLVKQLPKLAQEGTSGTYYLSNRNKKKVAIFKPFDEEPFTPNNPRQYKGRLGQTGIRQGILSGEQATRQVAAYLIDNGFHDVPPTTYVQFFHPSFERQYQPELPMIRTKSSVQDLGQKSTRQIKHGSLQAFVKAKDIASNYSSSKFSVDQVHKIAILDIRILNADRNEQNILLVDRRQKNTDFLLVPIDHGLSIPDTIQIYSYQLAWTQYPQVKLPLSQSSIEFVLSLDPVKQTKLLRQRLGFREICLRNFRVAGIFLKACVKHRFTLFQMSKFLYRQQNQDQQKPDQKSKVQKIIEEAEELYLNAIQNGITPFIAYKLNHQRLQPIEQREEESSELNSSPLRRSLSQPSLYRNEEKTKRGKRPKKERMKRKQSQKEDEEWGQLYFHYFQQLLQIFLDQMDRSRLPKRRRFNSQQIDY